MTDLTHAVGWALIHSLWQGTVILAVAIVALRLLDRAPPNVRYVVAVSALGMQLLVPIAAVVRQVERPRSEVAALVSGRDRSSLRDPAVASVVSRSRPSLEGRVERSRIGRVLNSTAPGLVLAWLLGVLTLAIRSIGGWHLTRRLARDATPAPDTWSARLERLAARLAIAGVELRESLQVATPVVIGWLRPMIVVPSSLLIGLAPQHLDAILLHELAHVRRHDYLVNLVQSCIETVLFYHPAVHWLSARIRIERERCCDDLAATALGDRMTYAGALATLAELCQEAPAGAMAATGGSLFDRIARLLGHRTGPEPLGRLPAAALVLALLAATTVRAHSSPRTDAPRSLADQGTVIAGRRVLAAPDMSAALADRWRWAIEQTPRNDLGKRFTVAWSVHTTIADADVVTSSTDASSQRREGPSLAALVNAPLEQARGVAFIFGLPAAAGSASIEWVRLRALTVGLPLEESTILWLGPATDAESIAELERLRRAGGSAAVRSELGAALSLHDDSAAVLAAVRRAVEGREEDEVRAETLAWLGRRPYSAGVGRVLRTAIMSDPSFAVRDEAISALRASAAGRAILGDALTRSPFRDVRHEAADLFAEDER